MEKIVTMGVYGFSKERFFQTLQDAGVDTFCDIRLRRGLRGSEYAFANSTNLQRTLQDMHIRYFYVKDLAPSQVIRAKQKQEDKQSGVLKRTRTTLSPSFVSAYEEECVAPFDISHFVNMVGAEASVVAIFCVERYPDACHRSLAAKKIGQVLHIPIAHLMPDVI